LIWVKHGGRTPGTIARVIEREHAMKRYRLSVIDKAGHVIDVYEPDCESDEEAYHKAELLVGPNAIDVWQGDRWIAWLDGGDPLRIALAHHSTAKAA
jgi:hypothetical protein